MQMLKSYLERLASETSHYSLSTSSSLSNLSFYLPWMLHQNKRRIWQCFMVPEVIEGY